MITQDFFNLTNKILIASPYTMEGNVFHQSLIYVVYHNADGAVGFIFNRLLSNSCAEDVLKKIQPPLNLNTLDLKVNVGGPVEIDRGFFLHSTDYDKNTLFKSEGGSLAVSSSLEILSDISNGKGPEHKMFIVGYTAWGVNQMEIEFQNNLWMVLEPDSELIFNPDNNSKWAKALSKLGVDSADFIPGLYGCA